MKIDTAIKPAALARLATVFPVGATVPVIRVSSSQSGALHRVMVLAPSDYGSGIQRVSYDVAAATGMAYDDRTGTVIVRGGGMDMGHWLVSRLSLALHGADRAISHHTI